VSSSWVLVVCVLIGALGLAYVIGRLITLRAGLVEASEKAADVDTSDLGLSETGPTVLHFSAVWCGPCAGVRRVVEQVCAELPGVAHV
jgi:thiol-disulfide isomerase/thioredoxin